MSNFDYNTCYCAVAEATNHGHRHGSNVDDMPIVIRYQEEMLIKYIITVIKYISSSISAKKSLSECNKDTGRVVKCVTFLDHILIVARQICIV